MSLFLVAYAVRSETATVAIVEAESNAEALRKAVDLEDGFFREYVEYEFARGDVRVCPVKDGLQVMIDAEH